MYDVSFGLQVEIVLLFAKDQKQSSTPSCNNYIVYYCDVVRCRLPVAKGGSHAI